MTSTIQAQAFIGKGNLHQGPWRRNETDPEITDLNAPGHPARYLADDGLIAAVNTAMLLNKPLLVTGNPGTGKSDLAERIAWELEIGPVLRFEAQSLSEASDLFYRFDLVGRMAESRLRADETHIERHSALSVDPSVPTPVPVTRTNPCDFIELGPLGKAILKAKASLPELLPDNGHYRHLIDKCCPNGSPVQPRSAVLIDEIDKASRDFPNDLLNGIDRMEFRIRELDNLLVKLPDKTNEPFTIVIITSNLERDLPAPFLRRCAFYHIPDPNRERMAQIVKARVFPERNGPNLPNFYQELLDFFYEFRETHQGSHVYEPGTTELIEVSRALKGFNVDETASLRSNANAVLRAISAFVKHREDMDRLRQELLNLTVN